MGMVSAPSPRARRRRMAWKTMPKAVRLGVPARRSALISSDPAGYVDLLRRLRFSCADTVYAPAFGRGADEPIGASVPVRPETAIVITEGNYLLLDAVWFLEIEDEVRVKRLIARHMEFGKTERAAQTWAQGSDQRNADIIMASAHRADLTLRL